MAAFPRKLLTLGAVSCALFAETPAETLVPVGKIQPQKAAEFGDMMSNTFGHPGERHPKGEPIPARGVLPNGEVPDSPWYTNRHASKRMSLRELKRGPGDEKPPAKGKWTIVSAKTEGVTPGFVVEDSKGDKYVIKFDPPRHPELASGADVVSSKFYHALGYHVPQNYVVHLDRSQLVIKKEGVERLTEKKLKTALDRVQREKDGKLRALASLYLKGEPVGPFFFYGVRADDPNDKVPHEHRRELRGLYLFNAWLNHTDSKAGNTLDMVVEENGVRHVRHYLIDFGATLGSATHEAKSPRQGYENLIDVKPTLVQFITLGLHVPKWARTELSEAPAVGAFEAEAFEPDKWKPSYPNPAFENRLPDDLKWAAAKIAAFTDDDIRAMVATGQFSDPAASDWIAKTIIGRRDKILRMYGPSVRAAARKEPASSASARKE